MTDSRIIRVFPRRTQATPSDGLAFVGDPPLFRPEGDEVHVSVTFTWDKRRGEELAESWSRFYRHVLLGGPAYDDAGGMFVPGRYLKAGYVVTSRGCPNRCWFCMAARREGGIRELPVVNGWNVLDNNLLACSQAHQDAVFGMLARQARAAQFTGGLDAARLNEKAIERLQSLRRVTRLYLAYDKPADRDLVMEGVFRLRWAGFSARQVGCYVLIGWPGDAIQRAEQRLIDIYEAGAEPFAMLYRDEQGKSPAVEWRRFQRTWARPAAYRALMRDRGMALAPLEVD